MPPVSVAALNATHPKYSAAELDEYEALYEGGHEWRELVGTWIPQNAQEPPELWKERKDRATYENHVGPIVDLIVAWLFSKPPTVDGLDADWIRDVDRRGTSLAVWTRQIVTDALKYKRAYAWVNLPSRAGIEVESRADEERLNLLDPFLVHLTAEEVRDWGEDEHGNLAWILVRRKVSDRVGVDGGRVMRYRWYWIDATQIRSWEFTPREGEELPDGAMAEERQAVQHGLRRMPVARLHLPAGLHVLAKLRDPAVGLLRMTNDLDWSLHRWANSLLVLATDQAAEPALGAGYYLRVGKDDKVFTVAPDASGFTAMQARVDDKREDLYRVVQQMAAGVSGDSVRQSASGAAKALDWQSLQVMLAAYAELVKATLRRVCQVAAVPLQVNPDEVAIGGLEGWQEDDLATILADFLTAQPIVKSATFKKLLARETVRRMLPDGVDEETKRAIYDEIDAADYGESEILAPPRTLGPGSQGDDSEDDDDVEDELDAAADALDEALQIDGLPEDAANLIREALDAARRAMGARGSDGASADA